MPALGWNAGGLAVRIPSLRAGGATLWAAVYISCGFIFAKQLDEVAQHISAVATLVVLIFGIPLVLLFGLKLAQLVFMIRLLRPLHIPPETLKSRLDSGAKLGIFDLLRFEEDPEGVAGIPGAVRLDPLEIRRKKRFAMPPDVDLVLYCRSRNSFVSARVAAAMRKHGIQNVYILKGGLEAWQSQGLPLSNEFASTEAELVRLGIEMSPPWRPLPPRKHYG